MSDEQTRQITQLRLRQSGGMRPGPSGRLALRRSFAVLDLFCHLIVLASRSDQLCARSRVSLCPCLFAQPGSFPAVFLGGSHGASAELRRRSFAAGIPLIEILAAGQLRESTHRAGARVQPGFPASGGRRASFRASPSQRCRSRRRGASGGVCGRGCTPLRRRDRGHDGARRARACRPCRCRRR
jgi:hypothetical protein